ncbi:hypothetical protein JCM10295v2_005838 [Rhodotorula toruloides]
MLLSSEPSKQSEQEYYQIAQYTCVYNAVERTVACKPFVRTFVRMANEQAMTEVTPTVNAGGRLPRGPLAVPRGRERQEVVAVVGPPQGS